MILQTLQAKKIEWTPKNRPKSNPSKGHEAARALIKDIWPTVYVCEECPVPVKRGSTLYFDFFIPIFKLVIEVDGKQHDAFSAHFHKHKTKFLKQRRNDLNKEEICYLNDFFIVRLKDPYDEETWREQIINYAQ